MKSNKMPPPHPGEFLKEELLIPMKISMYRLAKDINVPAIRISEIVKGKRAITPDTAIRLGKYFGMSAQFWLNWQAHYDMEMAKDQKEAIEKTITPYSGELKGMPKSKIHSLKADIALHP